MLMRLVTYLVRLHPTMNINHNDTTCMADFFPSFVQFQASSLHLDFTRALLSGISD
jgi:hypothetical protein